MSTHALHATEVRRPAAERASARVQATWLAAALCLGFVVPFVFADTLGIERDLYYGIYGILVIGFVAAWSRSTRQPLFAVLRRRWRLTSTVTALASVLLVAMVYKTEEATNRPEGVELAAAILWRGLFYGAVDGLLLSVFPILAVFAAFERYRRGRRVARTLAVGAVALVASLAMTVSYHIGYSDFRGEKLRKPVAGDILWSTPTLLTLNPIGAPVAHAALHTAAVLHSYETDTFLPPHEGARG
jgi:hypothetical protein